MKKILYFLIIFAVFSSMTLGQNNLLGQLIPEDDILNLKVKILELQNKGELGFRNFTFYSSIAGFGSYVPLQEPLIEQKGELLVYYEPINISNSIKNGIHEIWYTQDMILLKENREIIQEWKDILNFHYITRTPVMDFFAQNSLDLLVFLLGGQHKIEPVIKLELIFISTPSF